MNHPIIKPIQLKCKDRELTISVSDTIECQYSIANKERSKTVEVQILTPVSYLPEKNLDPSNIETACSFSIPADIFSWKVDFLIFGYQKGNSDQTSFLIVQALELRTRFETLKKVPESDGSYEMTIYAGSDDYILDATNISAEGEWYFFGGRIGKGTKWDYSMYLNQWNPLFDSFKSP